MNRKISISAFITWFLFLSLTIFDNFVNSSVALSPLDTLSKSIFARGMFVDVGILSLIIAAWIIYKTDHKLKMYFALATVFLGSLAALPYIGIYFWNKKDNE